MHPSLQTEELLWAEEICRKDAKVIESMREIGIETDNVFVDGASSSEAGCLRPCHYLRLCSLTRLLSPSCVLRLVHRL